MCESTRLLFQCLYHLGTLICCHLPLFGFNSLLLFLVFYWPQLWHMWLFCLLIPVVFWSKIVCQFLCWLHSFSFLLPWNNWLSRNFRCSIRCLYSSLLPVSSSITQFGPSVCILLHSIYVGCNVGWRARTAPAYSRVYFILFSYFCDARIVVLSNTLLFQAVLGTLLSPHVWVPPPHRCYRSVLCSIPWLYQIKW